MDERRSEPRFSCDVVARVSMPDGSRAAGRTVDVSASGICIVAPSAIPPGSHAVFELQLVLENASSDAIELPGRVVWCTRLPAGFQIGATFASTLDASTLRKLDNLLALLSGDVEVGVDVRDG